MFILSVAIREFLTLVFVFTFENKLIIGYTISYNWLKLNVYLPLKLFYTVSHTPKI